MERPETTAQDERSLDVLVVDDDRDAVEELVEYLSKATCAAGPPLTAGRPCRSLPTAIDRRSS